MIPAEPDRPDLLRKLLIYSALVVAFALRRSVTKGNAAGFMMEMPRYQLPSIPISRVPSKYHRQMVRYETKEAPGTIIVDTDEKFLYFVMPEGKALRYA